MKNASYALIAVLTFTTHAAFAGDAPTKALMTESMAALERSDWTAGVQLARAAVRDRALNETEKLAAVTNLCVQAANAGYLNEAVGACNESVKLAPERSALYVNRANLRLIMDDRAGANADYAKAKSLNPGSPLADRSKALIERGQGGHYVVLVTDGMIGLGSQLATAQAD